MGPLAAPVVGVRCPQKTSESLLLLNQMTKKMFTHTRKLVQAEGHWGCLEEDTEMEGQGETLT